MRNRIPFLKGESTESANPFGEEDEDEAIPEESGANGGGNNRNKAGGGGALAEAGEEEDEDKNEFDLPEWLAELPDDLEVSLVSPLLQCSRLSTLICYIYRPLISEKSCRYQRPKFKYVSLICQFFTLAYKLSYNFSFAASPFRYYPS